MIRSTSSGGRYLGKEARRQCTNIGMAPRETGVTETFRNQKPQATSEAPSYSAWLLPTRNN